MKKFLNAAAAVLSAAFVIGLVFGAASCSNATDSPAVPIVNQTAPGGNNNGSGSGGSGTGTGGGGQTDPNGGQPGSGVATTYKVNIAASIEHGSVTADPTSAAAGTEITLTATADQGYVWSSYTVTGAGGAAIAVSAQGKFTMPASDVTVSATFVVGVNASLLTFLTDTAHLTQDTTVAMTGQVTSSDIAKLASFLKDSSLQVKIKLDLRGVTGLDSLPQNALEGCEKLQSLSLPEGLASIGNDAFIGCENLESLYLPASYSFFDVVELAFYAGQKFSSINVAEGNSKYSSVDGVLFSKDKKTLLKSPQGKSGVYTVPAGVTTIGPNAFCNCSKLTGIVLPEGLQEIDRQAFQSTTISSMTIPSSVITIYDGVFSGNSSLTSLTFDDATGWYSTNDLQALKTRSGGTSASLGVAATNAAAFNNGNNDYYYKAVATSQNVAAFVQKVAALTQDSTVKLEGQIKQTDLAAIYKAINEASCKVKLDMSGAAGLSSLPEQAFESCAKLQEIILPQGIASIGNLAFSACEALESVSLPASVTSIGRDAFDPPNLLSVNVDQGNAVYSSVDGVLFSKDKKTLIFYPKGKSGSFAIPSGVKVIGKYAFSCCSNLTGVTIPDGVEKIEERAFDNSGITSLELPDSVTEIEDYAFNNCQSLTCVKLSSKLAKIGNYAFYATVMSSLVVPASVTSIGWYAFNYCSALTSVEFKAPSGWKRTTNQGYWKNKTGGESFDFSTNDFNQNATSIKNTYNSNCWYK